MAIIGTYCHKGGLEATSAALLIALGLHLRGRQVDLMQISTQPLTQSFDADVELPFGYKPFAWEGSESYPELLGTIDQARSDGRDLVIDLPYVPIPWTSSRLSRTTSRISERVRSVFSAAIFSIKPNAISMMMKMKSKPTMISVMETK
jgi:hypothetical protein